MRSSELLKVCFKRCSEEIRSISAMKASDLPSHNKRSDHAFVKKAGGLFLLITLLTRTWCQ
jgi:hypothetical protein